MAYFVAGLIGKTRMMRRKKDTRPEADRDTGSWFKL